MSAETLRRSISANLIAIAEASKRADGTDIPLGEQAREAAAEIERLTASEQDCLEYVGLLLSKLAAAERDKAALVAAQATTTGAMHELMKAAHSVIVDAAVHNKMSAKRRARYDRLQAALANMEGKNDGLR